MSSSEGEQSQSQLLSDHEEQQEADLDASETDSDDDENSEGELVKPKSLEDKVREELNKKYSERQGKQLYIRFPHKLPEEDDEFQKQAKSLSPLIVKAHKPRQKHARFCLVDFVSREDRDKALKAIKASVKKSERKIVVSIPRTENSEFVQELVQRKVSTLEKKKAKARLRHASKLALRAKNFTSSIVITNLPQSASKAELRRLFPTAVDVQIKPRKGRLIASSIAAVTLPTTMEARAAVKKKLSLGGTELKIRFDTQHKKTRNKLRTKSKEKSLEGLEPAAKN